MGDVLKKFGRYFLLDHIAQGGMAEIYRARLASTDGAGRLLVIKRIQAGYGANNEFVQMFKSEIKVTMGFNHPNIVQLYDFGEEAGQPYIAMEFVDGKNLRQFLSRFAELKQSFPVELAAYIMEQAAGGLHYAHSFKDKITGQPLNIVHRDISPQNIIVSYEGNVKVIDFGIAKAASNSESTRAGVIKGKPSYLSPEQISGEVLDGRCDLFALGIVFWELLTGKKLFAGENDLAVLKLIESCNSHVKPPSTLNPKVPKELDYIVLKALAKQREKRYQNGEEMQRALHKFLYSTCPDFNPGDLAYHGKDLFKGEIVEDRKRIQKLNEKVEQLIAADIPDAPKIEEAGVKLENKEDTTAVVNKPRGDSGAARNIDSSLDKNTKVDLEASPALKSSSAPRARGSSPIPSSASSRSTASSRMAIPQQRIPTQRSRSGGGKGAAGRPVLIAAAALVAVALFGPEFGINVPILSDLVAELSGGGADARLVLQGKAKGVQILVNGKAVGNALPMTIKGVPVGTTFQVTVNGPEGTFQQEVTLRKGEKKALAVSFSGGAPAGGDRATASLNNGKGLGATSVTTPDPTAGLNAKQILLRLNLIPGGDAKVMLNGHPIDLANPAVAVPLDAPLELTAERPGYKPFRREFTLDSRQVNGLREWLMDVQMDPDKFGFLTLRTTPSADVILVNGQKLGKGTPLENEKVAIGTYQFQLVNKVLGMEKTITVKIEEGKAAVIAEKLDIKN